MTGAETRNSPVSDCSISTAVGLLLESVCSISVPTGYNGDNTYRGIADACMMFYKVIFYRLVNFI